MSTAHVQIERVAAAAVLWCADQGCSLALAELEDAVAALAEQPAEPGTVLASAIEVARRMPGHTPAGAAP